MGTDTDRINILYIIAELTIALNGSVCGACHFSEVKFVVVWSKVAVAAVAHSSWSDGFVINYILSLTDLVLTAQVNDDAKLGKCMTTKTKKK